MHLARAGSVSDYSQSNYYWLLQGLPTFGMTGGYRQGRGQDGPQSEKDDKQESDHAFVVIPFILATLAFFAASDALRVGVTFPPSEKDAFHWAVAPSREGLKKDSRAT